MLDGIRKAANNWLGRIVLTIIMGVLILSFAIWGIGDMLRVQGNTAVATVGKTVIDAEQVRRTYTNALDDLSQRSRTRVTTEQAKAFGLDRQVIARLVSEAALDQKAKDFGLNLADEDVARITMAEPAFKGPSGQFDRARFYDVLRQAGMNEAMFFNEQKRSLMRRTIASAVGGEPPPPQVLLDAAYRYLTEERTLSYIVLPPSLLGEIAAPDEAALKSFFEGRKGDFRAPEYRKVTLLSALPAEIGVDLTVTEADLRRVYDRGIAAGQLGTPSKREVLQILYANEAEAKAAAEKLAAGTSFEALMEAKGVKPADANLGLKARREFADPAVAEASFALDEGQVSAPVKTGFGYALVKVARIDAGSEVPFDTAKDSLGELAKAEKLRSDPKIQNRLDEIQKKVEEAKIAGKALAEAAPLVGLALRSIDALDATGRDKAGKPVPLPGSEETLKAIYQSDIGLDNEALRLRDGGLVWFEIAAVEAARERTLDEAKAEVLGKWRSEEVARGLAARAEALVKRIEAGEALAAVAEGVEIKTAKVTRQNGGALGAIGTGAAFAVAPGKATSASLPSDQGRVVLKVDESRASPLDPASGVGLQFKKQLGEQLGEDLVTQYIQRVQSELGTKIDQRLLQNAIGGNSGS
jgi:peptidyl-prolyl cis-trans isomerase D